MNRLTIFPIGALFALALSANLPAADPQRSFGLAPAAPEPLQPSSSSPAQSSAVPLMPDGAQPADHPANGADKASARPAKKDQPNQTVVEDEKLHKHVQYRKAMTIALRDPGLQALRENALKSKTDFEYRKQLIAYYNGLFDLVEKIDKTLDHDEMEAMRRASTGRYLEARIEGTVDPATFRKKANP